MGYTQGDSPSIYPQFNAGAERLSGKNGVSLRSTFVFVFSNASNTSYFSQKKRKFRSQKRKSNKMFLWNCSRREFGVNLCEDENEKLTTKVVQEKRSYDIVVNTTCNNTVESADLTLMNPK